MKEKINLGILCSILLASVFFLLPDKSINENSYGQEISMITSKTINSNTFDVTCREFTIGVNILAAFIETDIWICCGFPPSASNPSGCGIFSEPLDEEREVTSNLYDSKYTTDKKSGFDLSNILHANHITNKPKEVNVISSSEKVLENGEIMFIKKGTYSVDKNNLIYLDFEIQKALR